MACLYELQGLICFSGAHYLAFLRVKSSLSPEQKAWHLFNDQHIELFAGFKQVVEFITSSNCVPTLVIYEQQRTKTVPSSRQLEQVND